MHKKIKLVCQLSDTITDIDKQDTFDFNDLLGEKSSQHNNKEVVFMNIEINTGRVLMA